MGFKDHLETYSFQCELPGTGEVIEYSPITTGQIKKLLVYENETSPVKIEEAFDNLLQSCVLTQGFNVEDLYLQDRYFLLIELRKNTKGELYNFKFTCPSCRSENMNGINFNNLPVHKRKEPENNTIVLSDKISLVINHITRGEQKEAFSAITDTDLDSIKSKMIMNTLTAGIKSVISPDGEEPLSYPDKEYLMDQYVNYSKFQDIQEWFQDHDFGIELKYDLKCHNCGFVSKNQEINIGSNFF